MERQELLHAIAASLAAVPAHHYEDERAFQGEFYAHLHHRLKGMVLPEGAMLREEYQKRLLDHGLRIRPDIILHEPFHPDKHAGRDDGNHAVLELKRRAGPAAANQAVESLVAMIDILRYPLGVFINVDSAKTRAELIPQAYRARITCFAVSMDKNGGPQVVRD
jgi:hypothetical protein